jgi:PPOX class probable F420-dependent enzyme
VTVEFSEAERAFVVAGRVARLATVDEAGQPHVVPVCFAFDGQRFYTALDAKPKRVSPDRLRRVRNILAHPQVALVIDRYDEDWTRLAYVQVHGRAGLIEDASQRTAAIALLRAKYPQYAAGWLVNDSPVIVIDPAVVVSWGGLSA